MNARVKILRQLVADGLYVVDENAIAEAMLLRSAVRQMLPDISFRGCSRHPEQIRSFRPHPGARSFRLTRADRRPGAQTSY